MEADKSRDFQYELANWRLRKTYGLVLVQVQRPETQEGLWCHFSLKARKLSPRGEPKFQCESK